MRAQEARRAAGAEEMGEVEIDALGRPAEPPLEMSAVVRSESAAIAAEASGLRLRSRIARRICGSATV